MVESIRCTNLKKQQQDILIGLGFNLLPIPWWGVVFLGVHCGNSIFSLFSYLSNDPRGFKCCPSLRCHNFHSVFGLFCYLLLHTPVSPRCAQIFGDKVMLM